MSGEISATIKWQGKDEPWLVVRGTVAEAKAQLAEAFGLDLEGLTLAEAVQTCQRHANAMRQVGMTLGATPVARGSEGGAWDAVRNGAATTPPAEPEVNPLVEGLANCTTQDQVKKYWAKNRPAFDADESMTAAMKARFKELAK